MEAAARSDATRGRSAIRPLLFTPPAIFTYTVLTAFNLALHAAFVNPDFWVRIASGRLVVEERIIPRHDPFTFTVRGGPWIDHEWLLGGAMYALNSVSYELLVVVAALVSLAPFLIIHRLAAKDRRDDWLLLALVAFAAVVAWRSYAIRPQLVNPLFFVALVWLIDDRRRTGSRRIWLAVPLTLAWANLMAGFIVGPAVLLAWSALCLLERRDRAVSAAVTAAALIVPLLNPYGIELYRYTVEASLSGNVDRAVVLEWQSPNFHDALNIPALAGIALMAYFGSRTGDAFRRVLGVGTLVASLISARFVPFFALALVYTVAPALPDVRFPAWGRRAALVVAPALALFALVAVVVTASSEPPLDREPVEGLAYLEQNAAGARVYADQSWGSYLTWSGWPTFFDTRTHQVFPEDLIADYHKVERTKGDWQAVLDRWAIEYVMMQPGSDLAEALDGAGWARVFEGEIEVIWRRP